MKVWRLMWTSSQSETLHIKAVFYVSAAQMSPLSYKKDKDQWCITASVQKRSSKYNRSLAAALTGQVQVHGSALSFSQNTRRKTTPEHV